MFIVKKIITVFIMPYTFSLLAILAGIILLYSKKHGKKGKLMVTLGFLSFLLFSFSPLTDPILSSLERTHPSYDGSNVDFVVVLGGGHVSDSSISVTSQLSSHSLARLCEGIRILKLNKGAKLIVCGWSGFYDKVPNAEVSKRVAVSMGVEPDRIITEPNPKDTIEESYYIEKIVKNKRVALVTSAFHMRRAAAIFKKRGVNFVTAPVFYYVKSSRFSIVPRPETMQKSYIVISEFVGYLWAKIKNEG